MWRGADRMEPSASLVVVAFNAGHFLQDCIDSLASQSHGAFECLIMDHATSDGSVAALRLPDARFTVHSMGANLGFAVANNRAADLARSAHLVLVNPDIIARPDFLAELLAAANAHPGAGAVGAVQLRMSDPDILVSGAAAPRRGSRLRSAADQAASEMAFGA